MAVSWLPRWVEVVDARTINVQHRVFLHESWQSPLVAAATRAHEQLGTTIVGFNEAVR